MIDDIYPSIISISIYLSIYLSTASTLRLSSEILLPADEVRDMGVQKVAEGDKTDC